MTYEVKSAPGTLVTVDEVAQLVSRACPAADYRGKKVLLIIPDGTRTAPIGMMFKALFAEFGAVASAFDILVALGTHPPMPDAAICQRLEITLDEWCARYSKK